MANAPPGPGHAVCLSRHRHRHDATPLLLAVAVAVALAAALAGCSRTAPEATPQAAAQHAKDKAAQLNVLYAEYWEEFLELNPIQATFQGDHRYDDQLPDFGSKQFREQQHASVTRWLDRVKAIGSDGLAGQDLLSYEIFVRNGEMSLVSEMFPSWMLPVNQMGSTTSYTVLLGSGTSAQPFRTIKDYDNWLARANRLPVLIDTEIANMREGIAAGVVQPRVVMEKVLPQFDAIITVKPEDSQFWGPIANMPADFPAGDRARLTEAYRRMIADGLMPALNKERDFIASEYLPKARDSVGLDALPDGQAWYAFNARNSTTAAKTPAEIHQIGLDEVARIHEEMRKVMEQVGFNGSLQDFFRFMQTDRQFEFKSEDALLEHYRALEAKVMAGVPKLFSLTPKAGFEIHPTEAFRAKSAAGGEYMSPSEDGSRPGVFYVNTYDLPTRKT